MARIFRYRVFFTPLIDVDAMTYGDEIDVSDRIELAGIGSIKKAIDSSDYDIGLYFYSDLTLKGYNHNGYFNDTNDNRSIFIETRDRCKVRVVWTEADDDGVETEFVTYQGLINEEATRVDAVTDLITFKVLSRDSVIRNTKVSAGTITNGVTVETALEAILSNPAITSVLIFDAAEINPDLNFTIDDGSVFDNKSTREVLNQLLLASNSVMLIEADGTMVIQARTENEGDVHYLFGKSDLYARENIIRITAYNTGLHRMFSAVKVNDTEEEDTVFSDTFGYRQKKLTLDFITDTDTESEIASRLLSEFTAPKIEMNVQVSMEFAKNVELLDLVSVDYPLRVKPIAGKFLPVVGATEIDDEDMPLPDIFGSIAISRNLGFKVIEIDDNPREFTSILKLRQIGTTLSDGVLNAPASCAIIGIGIIDNNIICGEGEIDYDPAIVGGAPIDLGIVA